MIDKKKVVLISDFTSLEVCGGAELFNEELVNGLSKKGFECENLKSVEATAELLRQNKDVFYIVANFMLLSEASKKALAYEGFSYSIIEHDWKMCKSNNPALFENLVVPEEQIQNKEFFKAAKAVFCQSKLHSAIMQKNLLLKNIVNVGCNIWSDKTVEALRVNIGKKKNRKVGILGSNNKNKGMPEAIQYCKENKINYEIIPFRDQEGFFEELAKTETLVMLPTWIETFCRVAIEARILGCKLITNKALGCASEEFFKLKGEELLNYVIARKEKTIDLFEKVINGEEIEKFNSVKLPKVSVITTIYNAKKHIGGYLESIVNQTIFNESELIIVDANSPENEIETIKPYLDKYQNIRYVRTDERINTAKAFNVAAREHASGEYIASVMVDDRPSRDHLEVLAKHLMNNPDVSVIYGNCLQTNKPNETFENNTSRGKLYEHSANDFTKENCIKLLMGPMPMYLKSIHDTVGWYDETFRYACDWKFMLEAVRKNHKLKKINKIVGLYYFNPTGISTSNSDVEKTKEKHCEEKQIFYEYKDVFPNNFDIFKPYFDSIG